MAKNVGKIVGINGNMVSVETDGQVSLNEVGYILVGEQKLKAEVIRISGKRLELQVFEATSGIGIGNTGGYPMPCALSASKVFMISIFFWFDNEQR